MKHLKSHPNGSGHSISNCAQHITWTLPAMRLLCATGNFIHLCLTNLYWHPILPSTTLQTSTMTLTKGGAGGLSQMAASFPYQKLEMVEIRGKSEDCSIIPHSANYCGNVRIWNRPLLRTVITKNNQENVPKYTVIKAPPGSH